MPGAKTIGSDTVLQAGRGAQHDISAPGQCLAALDLMIGLLDDAKAVHVEPGTGRYGIFAGKNWRNDIRPPC
ncbi:MAG: hypothetical protein AAGA71_14555 [Pseudomonadota bacterium]